MRTKSIMWVLGTNKAIKAKTRRDQELLSPGSPIAPIVWSVSRWNTRGIAPESKSLHKRSNSQRKETLGTPHHKLSKFNKSYNESNLVDVFSKANRRGSSKTYLKNLLQTKRIELTKLAHSPLPAVPFEYGHSLLTNAYLKDETISTNYMDVPWRPKLIQHHQFD
jgi:hypothetical protein